MSDHAVLHTEELQPLRKGWVSGESQNPGFGFQLCHVLALILWTNELTSLNFGCLICKMEITLPFGGYYKDKA